MFVNALIYHPGATMLICGLLICGIAIVWHSSPRVLVVIAIFLCLMPCWPIMAVRSVASCIVDLCDWLTVGRTWMRPFVKAASCLERKFYL